MLPLPLSNEADALELPGPRWAKETRDLALARARKERSYGNYDLARRLNRLARACEWAHVAEVERRIDLGSEERARRYEARAIEELGR